MFQLANLLPFDALQSALVYELIYSFEDVITLLRPVWYHKDAEERKKIVADLIAGPVHAWFQRFDRQLAHNASGYYVGGQVTIADIQLWNLSNWFATGVCPCMHA